MYDQCSTEEWRPIPGFQDCYEASSLGRIRRVQIHSRTGPAKIGYVLHQRCKQDKYLQVCLTLTPCRTRDVLVHRLVAEAFLGPCPEGWQVNHKDLDKLNNCVSNLEYLTPSQNQLHNANATGAYRGTRNGFAKLTDQQVREIRALRGNMRQGLVAELYGIDQTTISRIQLRQSWKHIK